MANKLSVDTFHSIFVRKVTTSDVNSIAVVSKIQTPSAATLNSPNLEFLGDNQKESFLNLCVPIHKFALEGDWLAAKCIIDKENKVKNAAIAKGWPTVLHIATGANHLEFVKQLLKMLDDNDLELQDINGNTAFCFAVAAGNIEMVDLMLERNEQLPIIKGGNGFTPIQYAASLRRYKMTWHLYEETRHCFEEKDWNLLFFTCIYRGVYGKYCLQLYFIILS